MPNILVYISVTTKTLKKNYVHMAWPTFINCKTNTMTTIFPHIFLANYTYLPNFRGENVTIPFYGEEGSLREKSFFSSRLELNALCFNFVPISIE